MGKLAMATVCPSRSKHAEEKQQLLQEQERNKYKVPVNIIAKHKRSDDGSTYSAEALSLIEGMFDDISYGLDCIGINCVLEDIRDLPGDFLDMFRFKSQGTRGSGMIEPSSSSPKGSNESTFVTGP